MKAIDSKLSITEKTIILSVFLLIFAFPVFYKLNRIPLLRWDESLYANCAFELAFHGKNLEKWDNYFFTEEPLYVSKPPMVIWLQTGFMKIFGYDSKLAIRLHSALAAILTVLVLIYFTHTEFKSIFPGLFSGLVLITTKGYLQFHIARSGDMDGLLILFTTLMILSFYKYLKYFENSKSRNINITIITVALIGGVLTKTAAAFFFMPALLVYAIYKKRFIDILKLRSTYIAIAAFIIVIGGYYMIKEITYPGSLGHLWEHDLGGRFFTTIHWASHPFYFYIKYIFTGAHTPWLFFVPLSILCFFLIKNKDIREFFIFSIICIVIYLLIVSSAHTKITWYMAQIYPLFALIVGFSIYYMFTELYNIINKDNFLVKFSFLLLFTIAIFFNTYYDRIQEIQSFVSTDKVHMGETYDIYEDCLAEMRDSEQSIKTFTVFHEISDSLLSWNPQLLFYQKVYNDVYGFNIDISYDPSVFNTEDIVLSNKNSATGVLGKYYNYDVIESCRDSEFIKITGIKNKQEECGQEKEEAVN
jgi:4-amino-4-deoxy-L-arabinose transferase-like glycosyltransferase